MTVKTALSDVDSPEFSREMPRSHPVGSLIASAATALLLAATVAVGASLARTTPSGSLPTVLTKLSSSSLNTRLSAISDLQKIMSATPSDQPAAVQALAAFIRRRSPAGHSDGPITPDIQAALDALSSSSTSDDHGARINLDGANLTNANLSGMNLNQIDLDNADLTGADLSAAIAM
jgi:Pentapeptide repeats (8 copies)